MDSFEREQILAELKRQNQRMTDTARALGLERSHLYKKCQALGIDLRAMRERGRTAGSLTVSALRAVAPRLLVLMSD